MLASLYEADCTALQKLQKRLDITMYIISAECSKNIPVYVHRNFFTKDNKRPVQNLEYGMFEQNIFLSITNIILIHLLNITITTHCKRFAR